MRFLITAILLSIAAFGQAVRIAPDEAAKHLVEKVAPEYPEMARIALIQGNIVLEINVNESGAASVRRLISGHPMLVQAAMDAVNRYKYQPFIIESKPVPITTLVMVRFGNPTNHDAEDNAELSFQHNFWTAADSAQAALNKGDFAGAEQQLQKASDVLGAKSSWPHTRERWLVFTTTGDLRKAQQKYDEAEQNYRDALALHEKEKNAPENAASLAKLGNLYAIQKRYELAREHTARSFMIYQKNFKDSKNPRAKQVYGQGIALASWTLSKLALELKDTPGAAQQCRTALEFQSYVDSLQREALVSACQQIVTN